MAPEDYSSPPPLLLGKQLAERAGCDHLVVVARPGSFLGAAPEVHAPREQVGAVEVRRLTPWSLAVGPWATRLLDNGVFVVDVDDVMEHLREHPDVDYPEAVGPALRRATFGLVVSARRDPGDLARLVEDTGATVAFAGSWSHGEGAGSSLVVSEPADHAHSKRLHPPAGFTVTAFVTVFNEEDVLAPVLDDLRDQGVQSYVLDNWSTDDSWDIAQERLGEAVVGLERWPADGPVEFFDLRANLTHITKVSQELPSDWFLKHDADEIRRAPWPGVDLATGLWMAQAAGYNVVDFTVMNYQPVDNGFRRGLDLWRYFPFFEFGRKPGHFRQLKAWRRFGQDVDYSRFGSHRVAFDGMRVHPYKFELHHYPIRSQDHGLHKVLEERQNRYLPAARARGWHTHYDGIDADTNLVRDVDGLWTREPQDWDGLLVERLSGAGLPRDLPHEPP